MPISTTSQHFHVKHASLGVEEHPLLISTSFRTKRALIKYLVRVRETYPRRKCYIEDYTVDGRLLWTILCQEKKEADDHSKIVRRFINCYLLHKTRKGWAYRLEVESDNLVHPSCPLRYLDVTEPKSQEWRRAVRRYHTRAHDNTPDSQNNTASPISFWFSSQLHGETNKAKRIFIKLLMCFFAAVSFFIGLLDVILDLGWFG